MKRIFVDIYLAFNLGDDLFLDILAKKYKDANFTVNYVGDKYDRFIENYENVKRRKYTFVDKILQKSNIKDTLTDYKYIADNHDALIFIGGSIFREEEYHKELYKERMKLVNEFKALGKPIFVLGSNFGPYTTQEFLNEYKEFFRKCEDVCFRDTYSYEMFKELCNVRYAPDIVFSLNIDEYKISKTKTVGFSIIDLNHKAGLSKFEGNYIESNVKAIEKLVNRGYECCLMSFCEIEGDLDTIKKIVERLDMNTKKYVNIYDYKGNIGEALKIIAGLNLFIAARFHGCIISQLLEVPLLPIIYSEKTENMLKDIGLTNIMINMQEIDSIYDDNVLEGAFENKTETSDIRLKAEEQFKKITEFIISR